MRYLINALNKYSKETIMKNLTMNIAVWVAALGIALSGCSVTPADLPQNIPGTPLVMGVAATGAPVDGTITLKDASNPPQVKTMATVAGGNFTFDVTQLTPPFILKADWTSNGTTNSLYTFTEGPGRANINPFSHAVFAAAAQVSEPSAFPASPAPAMLHDMAERNGSVKLSLMTRLAPLFELFGTSQNPVDDTYTADHTGVDAMFDAVKIRVTQGTIIVSNKVTGALIFTAQINDIDAGLFYMDNMPAAPSTSNAPGAPDGAALYASNCSGCHDALATSTKRGRTAAAIQSAISGNKGGMGFSVDARHESHACAVYNNDRRVSALYPVLQRMPWKRQTG
jgi:mono/diheme cytochrome c family protein